MENGEKQQQKRVLKLLTQQLKKLLEKFLTPEKKISASES